MRSSCDDGANRRRLLPWSYATFRGSIKCPSVPIRLDAPAEPGPEGPPDGLPTSAAAASGLSDAADPSWTFAPLRSLTETDLCEASRRRTPLQGSLPYSTFGSGKRLTRGCLPRLRCAFRVLHPLDALFLPKPHRRVSDGSAHGIPALRRFPLPRHRPASRLAWPAWRWLERTRRSPTSPSPAFRALPSAEVRCRRCKQRDDPILPWAFPPPGVVFPSDGPARHGGLLP